MGAEPLHRTSNFATSFNEQNSPNDREPTLPILFLLLFPSIVKGSPSPVSRCRCCLPKELGRVAGPCAGAVVGGAAGPYAGAIIAGATGPHACAEPEVAKVNLGKNCSCLTD